MSGKAGKAGNLRNVRKIQKTHKIITIMFGQEEVIYSVEQQEVANTVMRNSYWWMCLALLLTAGTAYGVINTTMIYTILQHDALMWGMFIAEFALVIILSAAINRLSAGAAAACFAGYSILNGMTMSVIFLVFTRESIASVFVITAAMFAAMALYGTVTKQDLSSWGRILTLALIGLIIATIVNIFMQSSGMYMIISYVGVLLFCGLTAYDAQKIKALSLSYETAEEETMTKLGILGALTLYLDFINLFLYLLRIFGKKR